MKRTKAISIVGCITVIATAIVWLIVARPMQVVAMIFNLWAEIALFLGLGLIEVIQERKRSDVSRIGMTVVVIFYSLISFVVSLIYALTSPFGIKDFSVAEVVFLAIALILCVLFYFLGIGRADKDSQYSQAMSMNQHSVDSLSALALETEDVDIKSRLQKMAEQLRYSDSTKYGQIDDEISTQISHLSELMKSSDQAENRSAIREQIETLEKTLQKRKIFVTSAQRGSF